MTKKYKIIKEQAGVTKAVLDFTGATATGGKNFAGSKTKMTKEGSNF